MHWIDWILVFVPLAVVLGFALYTNQYVKGAAVRGAVSSGERQGRSGLRACQHDVPL
jgi:hypothetical protein